MTSTTVASHTSQPLNFGPEWLRALSTPDATNTPLPNSGGSASGNIFKFSATKYRYSKDEILALRANVTERLAEDVRNAILENLKDVESVFRPNIIEPLTLTALTSEETARMSSLSSYISGRTPGGGGRGGHSSQQSSQQQQQQSHESRGGRGGSASANGRGGGARGRGGREPNFGPNRGNNNGEDNGENSASGGGGGGEESSTGSSWSRGTGFHNRNTGGTFNNRVRSYDDREQSQPFRRGGGGGGTRQTGEVWRRTRGDDDDNTNDQNDESNTANGPSWNSRSGTNNRPGGSSIEHRTKSSDKWSHKDDRPGPSNSFESSQTSSRGAWRTNSSMSDRDLNARRPPAKRDRMPEWMDDNNENDGQMSGATFDQNGTFTGPSTSMARSNNTNNSNESTKLTSQSSSEEVTSQPSTTTTTTTTNTTSSTTKTNEEKNKSDKSTPPRTDTAVVNVPPVSEAIVPKATPPVQPSISSWDDEFEPSDVATTVVEATLADDHDYSPPVSSHPTPHPLVMEPTPPTMPIIPQVQRNQPTAVPVSHSSIPNQPVAAPVIDDKQWFYRDPQNTIQGPFSSADMERWFAAGYFTVHLPVKRLGETQFSTIQQLIKELGRLPFRSDVPSLPPPPVAAATAASQPVLPTQMPSQSSISENQKFNLMNFPSGTPSNPSQSVGSAYLEDFLLQQQTRQSIHPSMLFNRQTSMPSGSNERKTSNSSSMVSPHMQGFFSAQAQQQQQQQQHHQSSSSLFSNTLATDPSVAFQHQVNQLQRSISATNNQPLFDELHRSFRGTSSTTSATSGFLLSNLASMSGAGVSQQPEDIMTRLAQAMQSHGQQQQEKAAAAVVVEQQRREFELQERLKMAQAEQARLREEEERRRLEDELRKKQETAIKKQMILEQMKEMNKNAEQKKTQQTSVAPQQPKAEIDPFLALQQSMQFQKDQQAKIEAHKAENVRRYQQQLREQTHPSSAMQPQQTFKLPETVGWARQTSQSHEQTSQPMNFAEIQKQEQEQERRAREALLVAQQMAKSEGNSSSSNQKSGSWARTLFAGGSSSGPSAHPSLEHETNESLQPESPITSFNQQATNAVLSLLNIHPKSRSTEKHPQSAPWNTSTTTTTVNTSLQDIQRQQQQQLQNEVKQQQHQQQQQSHSHSNSSTPAWGGLFSHSNSTSQSIFWPDQTNASSESSLSTTAAAAPVPAPPVPVPSKVSSSNSGNKSSTPWTDVKSSSTNSASINASSKSHSTNAELSKSEREAKSLFNTTRTQDALSKWAQTQFKDNLQAIDVPTLVQLLKDIDSAEEIVEYVQPYIGSVSKSREFARDFLAKRKQLANAEPELDNERLNALAMAPTSSNANSQNAGDEGFQVASSNGQKKKAKKMKGQKIDVKQLGFMVNNRPEQRDDIDRVQM